ncbi:MAG: helix-hairpin-helix domain-containing protein [Actinomycetota bacterium]
MSTRKLAAESFSAEFPPAVGRPANAALVHLGITTVEQLADLTEDEVLAIHGVGPKAVRALAAELAKRGLAFKRPP